MTAALQNVKDSIDGKAVKSSNESFITLNEPTENLLGDIEEITKKIEQKIQGNTIKKDKKVELSMMR